MSNDEFLRAVLGLFGDDHTHCVRCLAQEIPTAIQTFTFTTRKIPGVPDGTLYVWDVRRALQCVARAPRDPVPVDAAIVVSCNADGISPEHIDHVVPSEPGISVLLPAGEIDGRRPAVVIDGSHRAARCLRDGLPFTTYMLTDEEAAACQLDSERYRALTRGTDE